MTRPLRISLWLAGTLLLLLGAFVLAVQLLYQGRALPGTRSGTLDLAGRSEADAAAMLAEKTRYQELRYTYQGKTFTLSANEVGLAADPAATAREAVSVGHGSGLGRLVAPLRVLIGSIEVPRRYQLNEQLLNQKLQERTAGLASPTKNASIVRRGTDFEIVPEQAGTIVDPAANLTATRLALQSGQTTVPLYIRPSQPAITARNLGPAKAYATMLANRPVNVNVGDRTFRPPPPVVATWITFTPQDKSLAGHSLQRHDLLSKIDERFGIGVADRPIVSLEESTLYADVDREPIGQYVLEVANEVDRPPVNARVAFTGGQLTIAGQPSDGVVVDRAKAVTEIAEVVRSGRRAELPVVVKKADIRPETLPTLGITQLIGSSTTTFGGSPANRTYNIGVGAAKFDGVLIKPGEEFSFNAVLGDVGPETGYLPELVIKENQTVPEYGGGLCQVSTTMFRAALDAGLPITDRTNHSYAVHYYEPIGMDATIYPPDPDMKFRNNTGKHILVQTRRAGQSVTFDFFGTSDGRQARTEIIHINASEAAGGTASFRYVVEGGPDPINRVFSSSYRPQSAFPISRSFN